MVVIYFFPMTAKAIEFALNAHKGQKRKDGSFYFTHCERVARIVKENKDSHLINDLISAAYLHDTIEDTYATEEDILINFNPLIASLVKSLTSDKQEIRKSSKKEYLSEKMVSMSSWGLVIKLADRLDNVSDLNNQNREFRNRYKNETLFILKNLKDKRKLSPTHKKLISTIEQKLNKTNP